MKRLLPLIALVSLIAVASLGYIATLPGDPVPATRFRAGEHLQKPIMAVIPVTPTIIAPGQSAKILLTPQPISGNAALILEFQILNEWGQLHNADIFVNGEQQGHNLATGEIQLPGEGKGIVLEFMAESYDPISYTLNYKTKSIRRQQLTVQLQ